MLHELLKRRQTRLSLALIGLFLAAALLGPLVCPWAPDTVDETHLLTPPLTGTHVLGTDQLGRDVLSRLLAGARVSLAIGFVVVVIASSIGVLIGAVAGSFGGALDAVLMRLVDIALCFPVTFLILSVIAVLEPSTLNIILILGLTAWMGQARLVRAEILSLKERDFVLLARAYGASRARIIRRHLVPNAAGPVIVTAIFGVASAILAEAALSFLGLGVQPPTPSWGNMLADARATLGVAWWQSLFPGAAIFLVLLALNGLGESARACLSDLHVPQLSKTGPREPSAGTDSRPALKDK
ncbi:MAG: ABC transporter permease [Deltaproteobacteria bacterium]